MSSIRTGPRQGRGLTLVELMVAVAVLAILATVAAPSMGAFVASRRVEDAARRLAEDMHVARNEAIKRNTPVLMCADASITNGSCNTAPAAADWAKGWRVCVDGNGDGACDAGTSADPGLLRVGTAPAAGVALTGPASRLRFNASGSVTASAFNDFRASHERAGVRQWTVRFAASGALLARRA